MCGGVIEQLPGQRRAAWVSTKVHPGDCKRAHDNSVVRARRARNTQKVHDENGLDNYVAARDVERQVGLKGGRLYSWLRNKEGRRPHKDRYKLVGSRGYVRLDLAQEWLDEHPTIPKGYRPLKVIEVDYGRAGTHQFDRLRAAGLIEPISRGGISYLSPRDLALVQRHTRDRQPPQGYVSVPEIAKRAGVARTTVHRWLQRRQIKTKPYASAREARGSPLASYVSESVAHRYVHDTALSSQSRRKGSHE